MAKLSSTDRQSLWSSVMSAISENREPISVSKSDLRAAIDATDDWIDNNALSYNLALPAASRNSLTAAQKSRLFREVARLRFQKGM
jgi:hypothetical protein